jgi:undecaprenyl-diphosphatase
MNTSIFYFFYHLSHKSAIFDWIVVFVAEPFGWLVLGSAIVYLFYFFAKHPHWRLKKLRAWVIECITVGVSVAGAYAVSYVLKILFHAPRPFVSNIDVRPLVSESWYSSFPSGHATLFFALATAIYFYDKRAGAIYFVVAVLIAISRVVVGVHYPGDVIAGALIGVIVAAICQLYLFPQKPVK